jgi:uncharacterized protein YggE
MKKKTIWTISILLIISALIAGCSSNGFLSLEKPAKKLQVTGTGIVKLEPDIARVNIGVRSEASEAAEALQKNNANIEAIIQSMKDLGVAAEDIQTRNFSIYAQQNQQPREAMIEEGEMKEVTRTYVVENTVAVTVRDLDSLGEILSTVVAEGANTIYGVVFDIEDRESARDEARLMAIEDAQNKAKAIAEEAGVSLSEIQLIDLNESSNYFAAREEMAVEMPQGGGSVPIESGTLTIRMTANLTYSFD